MKEGSAELRQLRDEVGELLKLFSTMDRERQQLLAAFDRLRAFAERSPCSCIRPVTICERCKALGLIP